MYIGQALNNSSIEIRRAVSLEKQMSQLSESMSTLPTLDFQKTDSYQPGSSIPEASIPIYEIKPDIARCISLYKNNLLPKTENTDAAASSGNVLPETPNAE